MKLKTYTKLAGIFACIISVTLSSCSEKSSNTGDTSTEKKASALEGIILTEAPKEVSSIAEIRKSAKPGDKVTFTGSAIGAMKIFMDKKPWELKMTYKGKASNKKIKGLGRYDALVISPELITGDVFPEGSEMKVYASDDENRIPLLIESPVSVGSVKAILKSYSGLKYDLKKQ